MHVLFLFYFHISVTDLFNGNQSSFSGFDPTRNFNLEKVSFIGTPVFLVDSMDANSIYHSFWWLVTLPNNN